MKKSGSVGIVFVLLLVLLASPLRNNTTVFFHGIALAEEEDNYAIIDDDGEKGADEEETWEENLSETIIVEEGTDESDEEDMEDDYEIYQPELSRDEGAFSNTACTAGLRFRDVSDLTDEWDMFTPLDLSREGVYGFDLLAGNMHVIGKVSVTIQDGTVNVQVIPASDQIELKSEFLTFLPELSQIETLDQSQLENFPQNQGISIQDDLNGAEAALLYLCNRYYYTEEMAGVESFNPMDEQYGTMVEECTRLMEELF